MFQLRDKEGRISQYEKEAAGLETGWPDAEGYWYYGTTTDDGKLTPLIIGRNNVDHMQCEVFIADHAIYMDYSELEAKVGKQRQLLMTVMMDVEDEDEMIRLGERFFTKCTKKGKGNGKVKGGNK